MKDLISNYAKKVSIDINITIFFSFYIGSNADEGLLL